MKGAWLLFCLIALPRLIDSIHIAGRTLTAGTDRGVTGQFVPGAHDFPAQNSPSVCDKLPAGFLDEPFVFFSTAPAESLVLLPGLGPVLAARICDSRGGKRSFNSWDDLLRVRGIGPKTVSTLKRLVEPE